MSEFIRGFQNLLVVAPHADDETLGAGGTIARFIAEGGRVTVALMTGAGPAPHPFVSREDIERVRIEFGRAMKVLGVQNTIVMDLPTTLLDTLPQYILNQSALKVIEEVDPDLVLLPFEHDLHKDHGLLNYAFRVALRPHLSANRKPHAVLAYETATETHLQSPYLRPSFEPNVWIDISGHVGTKLEALSCFESQMAPAPALRSIRSLEALATWRGAQIGVKAAESFVLMHVVS